MPFALIECALNYLWFAQAVYSDEFALSHLNYYLEHYYARMCEPIDIPVSLKTNRQRYFFFSFTQNTMSMFNFADKSVNDWIYIRVDRKSIREELPQTYAIISAIQFGIYGRSLIIYYANENEFYVLNTLFKKSYYLIFLCWYQIAVVRSFYKKFL